MSRAESVIRTDIDRTMSETVDELQELYGRGETPWFIEALKKRTIELEQLTDEINGAASPVDVAIRELNKNVQAVSKVLDRLTRDGESIEAADYLVEATELITRLTDDVHRAAVVETGG